MKRILMASLMLASIAGAAGGVAVVDSDWLLRSSACDKALWRRWSSELVKSEGLAKCEATRRAALIEEELRKAVQSKIGQSLEEEGYSKILDLAVDKEAAKTFKADPTISYELLVKIDNEWFPASWLDSDTGRAQ